MSRKDSLSSGRNLGRLVQPAVMALLSRQPLHGYRIVQRLGEMPMFAGHPPDPAGVYRMLKSMEEEGLLSSKWDAGQGGLGKRQFALTVVGQAGLRQWMRTLEDYAEGIGDLLDSIRQLNPTPEVSAQRPCVRLSRYTIDGRCVDSLDLKVMLLTQGVCVDERVYEAFGKTHRISRDPLECSGLFLPDQTVVHIADIGPASPFRIVVGPGQSLQLLYCESFVAEITLPPASAFYRQTTSRGVPFRGMAVLQGHDVLTFPYLWPCDFAKAGHACRFCHCGSRTQAQWAAGAHEDLIFTPGDVAEVVHYAVSVERCARHVQLTGGSSFNADGECGRAAEMLREIDRMVGLHNIAGEIMLFTTPPAHVGEIDALFAAGVDRVACDIEIWDQRIAAQICPGKTKWTGRQRYLDALQYIAKTHGAGRACSNFVVGLEPAESFLEGAEYLAGHGIVPIPSIWMPHGLAPIENAIVADVSFYKKVKEGLADIYCRHGCQPPGDLGFNVCLCRDTWNFRAEILRLCS